MSDTTSSDELENMSEEEKAMMEQWETMADDGDGGDDADAGEGPEVEADAVPAFDGMDDDEAGGTRILNQDENLLKRLTFKI